MKRLAFCIMTMVPMLAQSQWKPLGLDGGGSTYSISGSPHDPKTMMVSSDMSGAFISRDRGRSWTMIHHRFVRGNTRCRALFDPDVRGRIYFPKSNGSATLCRSDDGGKTWAAVTGTPWKSSIVYVGKVKGTLYVGALEGTYRLEPGKTAWAKCDGVKGACYKVCMNHDAVVIGTNQGVYRASKNGFRKMTGGREMERLTGFTGNAKHLYVTVPSVVVAGQLIGGIYHSANGGSTWKRLMSADLNHETKRSSPWANTNLPQYRWPMTTESDPSRVYVYCTGTSYYPPNHSTIYRSDDAGKSWRSVWHSDPRFKSKYNVEDDRVTLGIGQRYQYPPGDISVNPADSDVIMMSTAMLCFFSYNGGKSWHGSQDPNPSSTGKHSARPMVGLGVTTTWKYAIDPHNPKRRFICYTDIGMARSLDGGESWIWDAPRLPWKNTTYDLAFDPDREGRVWGAFSRTHDIPNYNLIAKPKRIIMKGGVGVSLDGGESWKALKLPQAPCLSVVVDPKSPVDQRRLYASLYGKGVYVTKNGGKTWGPLPSQPGTPANRNVCRLLLHKDGTLFCLVTAKPAPGGFDGLGPGLYHTVDQGKTWTKTTQSRPLHWPKDFDVNPNDSSDVLLGAATIKGNIEAGLYRTRDKGQQWTRIARFEKEHFGGYFHPSRTGWIYATCTEDAKTCGLHLSKDDGKTWKPFRSVPFANVQRVHVDPNRPNTIFLSTYGASILEGPAEPKE